MLKIVTAPNQVLSQKAESVKKINKEVLNLIAEMEQTLIGTKDPVGVGLAAPQVGKSMRIILVKPTPKSEILVCINPKILSKSVQLKPLKRPKNSTNKLPRSLLRGSPTGKFVSHFHPRDESRGISARNKRAGTLEGCLSLPTIWGTVLRSSSLTFFYVDEHGKTHTRSCKGFLATIIQHEIDHLDGILFTKRVLEQKGKLYKSHKNKQGEDEFEEIKI